MAHYPLVRDHNDYGCGAGGLLSDAEWC